MKPFHTLLFLLAVLGILSFISYIFPQEGIKINDSYSIKFFSIKDWQQNEKPQYADISHLYEMAIEDSDTIDNSLKIDTTINLVIDSITTDSIEIIDTIKADARTLKKSTTPLILPDNNPECLQAIFSALKNLKDNQNSIVRIMHYGDSQIEGDRISSILRRHLQRDFGGNGLGLFSAYEENNISLPLETEYTGTWQRYTNYGIQDSSVKHNHYGMLASFSRFTPINNDSIIENHKIVEASINISPKEVKEFASRNQFRKIKIFVGNNHKPAFTEIYSESDSLLIMKGIDTTQEIKTIEWTSNKFEKSAKIKFIGEDSPDIYGISLEDTVGVIVDNIAMRGSAGTIFTKISKSHQKKIYNLLNPQLIILEFGVNVVPNITNDYGYYETGMYKQIRRLQEVCPQASIIVIGVSDMAQKEGSYYQSYPNIELIRDAQKHAAQKAGCAFWDMYEAMGGHNSMPSWVFAEPALAQKDFTHFTYYGSKIIGDMFYNAFKYEYEQFLNQTNQTQP